MSNKSFIFNKKLYGDIHLEATLHDCNTRSNSLKILCGDSTEFPICKDVTFDTIMGILKYAHKDLYDLTIDNKITRFTWKDARAFNANPVTIYGFSERNSVDNDYDFVVKVGVLDPLDNLSCYKFRQKQFYNHNNINEFDNIRNRLDNELKNFIEDITIIGNGLNVCNSNKN